MPDTQWNRVGGLLGLLGVGILSFLAPLLLVLVGIVMKFTIIDEKPLPSVDKYRFFVDTYAKDVWLALILTAYVTGVGWYFAKGSNARKVGWFLLGPTGLGVLCLVLVQGLPKLEYASDFWTIWLPAGVGVVAAGISGMVAREP